MTRVSAFKGTYIPNRRPYITLTPDVYVSIQGETSVIGCGECRREISFNRYLTSVSTEASVDSPPGSANFTLSIPDTDVNDFYVNGQFLIVPMMEIEIYAKGYFTVGGFPQYYKIFWGLVSSVTKNWSNGTTTITVNCRDILRWWELTYLTMNPAFVDPIGSSAGNFQFWGNQFAGSNPYEVIISLAKESMGDFSHTTGSFIQYRPDQGPERQVTGEYVKDIMAYWQLKFGNIWNNLVLYGSSGTAYTLNATDKNIRPRQIAMSIFEEESNIVRYNQQTAIFRIQPTEVAVFRKQLAKAAEVDFFQAEQRSKLSIAMDARDQAGNYEFYCDTTGDIVFKPPFYNLNVMPNKPTSWIQDFEIIDDSVTDSEAEVFTHITSSGNAFGGVMDWGLNDEITTPRTAVYDYHLLRRYGWRRLDYQVEWAGNPRKLFFHLFDVLDRTNAKRQYGNITIPMRPELRMGFPVWVPKYDSFFYVSGISHNFSAGGQATTVLTLTAKRSKFIAPRNIGRVDKTGASDSPPNKNKSKINKKQKKNSSVVLKEVDEIPNSEINPLFRIEFPSETGETIGLNQANTTRDWDQPVILRHPETGRMLGFPNAVMVYRTTYDGQKLATILAKSGSMEHDNPKDKNPKSAEGTPLNYNKVIAEVRELLRQQKKSELIGRLRSHRYEAAVTSLGAYDYAHDTSGYFKEMAIVPTESVTYSSGTTDPNDAIRISKASPNEIKKQNTEFKKTRNELEKKLRDIKKKEKDAEKKFNQKLVELRRKSGNDTTKQTNSTKKQISDVEKSIKESKTKLEKILKELAKETKKQSDLSIERDKLEQAIFSLGYVPTAKGFVLPKSELDSPKQALNADAKTKIKINKSSQSGKNAAEEYKKLTTNQTTNTNNAGTDSAQFIKLKNDYDKAVSNIEKQNEIINKIQTSQTSAQQKFSELENQLAALKVSQGDFKTGQISKLKSDIKELGEKIDKLQIRIEKLKSGEEETLDETDRAKKLSDSRRELQKLVVDYDQLQKKLRVAEDEFEEAATESDDLFNIRVQRAELEKQLDDLNSKIAKNRILPNLNIMIRPVSDEFGFEVIGHYRYGRGAFIDRGKVKIEVGGKDRPIVNDLGIQFAATGSLIENFPMDVNLATNGPETLNFAEAFEDMRPEDWMTGASFKANFSGKDSLDGINYTGQETYSSNLKASKTTTVFVEADSLRKSLTLAELKPSINMGALSEAVEDCDCWLGKAEWLSVLPKSVVGSILGKENINNQLLNPTGTETQIGLQTPSPQGFFKKLNEFLQDKFDLEYGYNVSREKQNTTGGVTVFAQPQLPRTDNILGDLQSSLFQRAALGDPDALEAMKADVNFAFGETEKAWKDFNKELSASGAKIKQASEDFRESLKMPTPTASVTTKSPNEQKLEEAQKQLKDVKDKLKKAQEILQQHPDSVNAQADVKKLQKEESKLQAKVDFLKKKVDGTSTGGQYQPEAKVPPGIFDAVRLAAALESERLSSQENPMPAKAFSENPEEFERKLTGG